ncbi:MAG: hypothetical protein EAZ36_05445, partial [Verrucomicrobia bacterium]
AAMSAPTPPLLLKSSGSGLFFAPRRASTGRAALARSLPSTFNTSRPPSRMLFATRSSASSNVPPFFAFNPPTSRDIRANTTDDSTSFAISFSTSSRRGLDSITISGHTLSQGYSFELRQLADISSCYTRSLRGGVFRVTGWLGGKRLRKNFPIRAVAAAERQTLEIQRAQSKTGVRIAATRLTGTSSNLFLFPHFVAPNLSIRS